MGAEGNALVSVVLPTYNRPERLRRAVRTVLSQTYDRVQLVVVDDHSETPARKTLSDVSFDQIESVVHVRHETNEGANAARNTGIEAADGEFIAFLDDDDLWEPEKLERQVSVLSRSGPDVGVVYTGRRYVDPDGNELHTETPNNRGDVTKTILRGGSIAEFSAVMVRAAVVSKAGLPDERFPSWQDRDWYLRLSRHCNFEAIPEPLMIRQQGYDDQINKNYEAKKNVSYPLFLEKHRSLAAEYGWRIERQFVASLSRMLARSAMRNRYYADARKFFLKSLYYYPFRADCYAYLLALTGGERTYRISRQVLRAVKGR